MTVSSTMTFAGFVRSVGGGTCGGLVSTACTGSPCGGPKSPFAEPPVAAAGPAELAVPTPADREPQPLAVSAAAIRQISIRRFMAFPPGARNALWEKCALRTEDAP